MTIYHNDIMRYYSSIPFGGKSITNDIKLECGTSERLAENIKLGYGVCMPDKLLTLRDKILQINNPESGSCKQLSVKYLSEVITDRVKEIVDACLYKIQESGFGNTLRNGIVITGGSAEIPNLSTYVKELSGYNIRIGYPRQKFSYVGCPEINETSAVASVGMIMASKEDKYLNCLSEAPVRPVKKEETVKEPEQEYSPETEQSLTEEPDVETGYIEPSYPQVPTYEQEKPAVENSKEEKRPEIKEHKARKWPKIKWTNPFDNITKKVNDKIGQIIDNGYDGMEE